MGKFIYVARNGSGKRVTGSLDGTNEEDVISRIQVMEKEEV